MARAIWTGSLTFGLVSIPVRLHNATAPKDVRFHQLDRATGQRIRQQRVVPGPWPAEEHESGEPEAPRPAPVEGGRREVPSEDLVRGFEQSDHRFVEVTEEELQALRPERSHAIDIEEFVHLGEIDPVYFEKSYYVSPQRGGEKPYGLLVRAMEKSGRVAIARFVLRTKEHLAAVRPTDGILVLETLFFADEVIPIAEIAPPATASEASTRELKVAIQLIEMLANDWDPSRHRDTYRERLLELIQGKAESGGSTPEEPARPAPEVADLLQALRASVEAAGQAAAVPRRRRRPTA